jgi:transglutaminase-like putative cysteine protease
MDTSNPIDPSYTNATAIIDSDHAAIIEYAQKAVSGKDDDPLSKAVALYYAVRDGIRYDPYYPFYRPAHYRASAVLASGHGYCVSKASLLCALGRAQNIPTRIGFATVRNHLTTKQLHERMGSDLFVYHGYTEFFLEGKWVMATPAFNATLCQRHQVAPLEFNGREDSIFQPFNKENKKYMEYVSYLGTYADVPVATIVAAWQETYGHERVARWIDDLENARPDSRRDFYTEDVVKN